MRDQWYGDHRDLVKWSILLRLAEKYEVNRIFQVVYYRKNELADYGRLLFTDEKEGQNYSSLAEPAIEHFRDVDKIQNMQTTCSITIHKTPFIKSERDEYHDNVKKEIEKLTNVKCIIFLDPDTGLEPAPGKAKETHVTEKETLKVWKSMKPGDVFVFYQHRTNRNSQPWLDQKQSQLRTALKLTRKDQLCFAQSESLSKDIVLYYVLKP